MLGTDVASRPRGISRWGPRINGTFCAMMLALLCVESIVGLVAILQLLVAVTGACNIAWFDALREPVEMFASMHMTTGIDDACELFLSDRCMCSPLNNQPVHVLSDLFRGPFLKLWLGIMLVMLLCNARHIVLYGTELIYAQPSRRWAKAQGAMNLRVAALSVPVTKASWRRVNGRRVLHVRARAHYRACDRLPNGALKARRKRRAGPLPSRNVHVVSRDQGSVAFADGVRVIGAGARVGFMAAAHVLLVTLSHTPISRMSTAQLTMFLLYQARTLAGALALPVVLITYPPVYVMTCIALGLLGWTCMALVLLCIPIVLGTLVSVGLLVTVVTGLLALHGLFHRRLRSKRAGVPRSCDLECGTCCMQMRRRRMPCGIRSHDLTMLTMLWLVMCLDPVSLLPFTSELHIVELVLSVVPHG